MVLMIFDENKCAHLKQHGTVCVVLDAVVPQEPTSPGSKIS